MDNDVKKLLGVLAVATIIILVTKPKGLFKKKTPGTNITMPQKADTTDKLYEHSVVAIKAMREAIKSGESPNDLDELNREILNDYGIKVFQDKTNGKLYTCDREGKKIAQES